MGSLNFLERLRCKDREAGTAFVGEYSPLIVSMVKKCYPRADAHFLADATQDVLVSVLFPPKKPLPEFDSEAEFLHWLCRVAINKAHDVYRQDQRHITQPSDETGFGASNQEPVSAILERMEELDKVDAVLKALDERSRMVVREHVLNGRKMADIAAEHGIPEGTVRSWFFRARVRLADALGGTFRPDT